MREEILQIELACSSELANQLRNKTTHTYSCLGKSTISIASDYRSCIRKYTCSIIVRTFSNYLKVEAWLQALAPKLICSDCGKFSCSKPKALT